MAICNVLCDSRKEQGGFLPQSGAIRVAGLDADCLTSAVTDEGGHEGNATNFDPWAASVGVALLRLQARASAPRWQPSWVNRRVEQLEFLDTRAVRWRVSIDFNVPDRAPKVQTGNEEFRLVPIASLAKTNLVAFSLCDEESAAVCMPTSRETAHYLASALVQGASRILNKTPPEIPSALAQDLERIVSGDPRELRSGPPALLAAAALIDADRNLDHALSEFHTTRTQCEETRLGQGRLWYDRQLQYERAQRELGAAAQAQAQATQQWRCVDEDIRPLAQRLMANKSFRSQVEELAQNFVVHVATKTDPGIRRIIKLTYESYAPRRTGPGGWLRKFWQSLGWRLWQFDVLIGGRGGSYHLEVAAPAGVDVVGITADRLEARELRPKIGRWRRFKAWWHSLIFWEPTADVSVPGHMPHVHINPPNGSFVRYRAAIFVRVSRPGWLTASWGVTFVIGAVIIVGRLNLPVFYSQGTTGNAATAAQAGTAAILLLTLLGVFATMLLRPGEHPLASRLLRMARFLILLDAAVVLVSVGYLILHQHPIPLTVWTWTASVACAVFVLFTISWLVPVARPPRRE